MQKINCVCRKYSRAVSERGPPADSLIQKYNRNRSFRLVYPAREMKFLERKNILFYVGWREFRVTVIRAPIEHDFTRAASSRVFVIAPPKKMGCRSHLSRKKDNKTKRERLERKRRRRIRRFVKISIFFVTWLLNTRYPYSSTRCAFVDEAKTLSLSPVRSILGISLDRSNLSFMTIIKTTN